MIFGKSFQDILNNTIEHIKNNTPFTAFSPGSKIYALLNTFAILLEDAYKTFDSNFASAFIHGAHGKYLDLLADTWGMRRLKHGAQVITPESRVLKFYTNYNNFGTINNGENIYIPKYTILNADSTNSEIPIVLYTTEDIVLPANTNEKYFGARFSMLDTTITLPPNSITKHNFKNYAFANQNALLVTNVHAITIGQTTESDDNFKYRLSKYRQYKADTTKTAIELITLSIPEVALVEIDDTILPGMIFLYIVPTNPDISNNIVSKVYDIVKPHIAAGIELQVIIPQYVYVDIEITPTFKPGTDLNTQLAAIQSIENIAKITINNKSIREGFTIQELTLALSDAHPAIQYIGNTYRFIDHVYVRKTLPGGRDIVQEIIHSYIPSGFEKLLFGTLQVNR